MDSFKTTAQFSLSACRILISLLYFTDYSTIGSFLVMLDIKGFDFSNIHQSLLQNFIPKAGGSLDLADSAASAMSKLDFPFVTTKLVHVLNEP